jgi:hypothetical protein
MSALPASGRDGRETSMHPTGATRRVERFSSVGEVLKFAAVAAVLAMVSDAVVGHALLWQNDPYWTYWVTDTLLITTVFSIGTALLGAGIARGAMVTVVQMLVLTTYYWSLSPIGLPADPEWLDLQHTWVTGPPVHFGVYYLGYLVALWLWRRRSTAVQAATPALADPDESRHQVISDTIRALVTALAIVVLLGTAQTVALGEFPGVTWLVMRAVILVPFILGWWGFAGRDRSASVAGGVVAAALLAAYGHYLGPVGLPNADLRVLAQDAPPADVHWLSYTEEFLVMGPITIALAVAAFLAASRWHGYRWTPLGLNSTAVVAFVAALGLIAAAGFVTATALEDSNRTVTVVSTGDPRVAIGTDFDGALVAADGDLRFRAVQTNTKRTPLLPHDAVNLQATITHPDGTLYEVIATNAMVNEPNGRFPTWGGVGIDRWHHGRSGVGTTEVEATRSEVAIYALGEVRADGKVVATGAPVHAMTVDGAGVELHVGDVATPLTALPDGHLRIVWDGRRGDSPEAPERARHLLGGLVLLTLIATAFVAARNSSRSAGRSGRVAV